MNRFIIWLMIVAPVVAEADVRIAAAIGPKPFVAEPLDVSFLPRLRAAEATVHDFVQSRDEAAPDFQNQRIDWPSVSSLEAARGRAPELLAECRPRRRLPPPGPKRVSFLTFTWESGGRQFGLSDAQKMADQEVHTVFGDGTATFHGKFGVIWTFTTNLGYAGRRGPNIAIIEPVRNFSAFSTPRIWPNNSPEATPGQRPPAEPSSSSGSPQL